MSTKKFKKTNSIPENAKSIRPFLTKEQVSLIARLERIDIGLVISMPEYNDRKEILTRYHNKLHQIARLSA